VPGGQPNAWTDVDNDGDLDLFVANQNGDSTRTKAPRWTVKMT